MPSYKAPVKDMLFLLNEVVGIEKYANLEGFANASPDLVEAVLNEAAKFCEDVLAPINYSGDQQGCTRHADGSVTTPDGFKAAYKAYCEAGWTLLTQPEEFGGQGLPHVIGFPVEEFRMSANQAFAMYPGLTQAAISAVLAKASDELKAKYAPKMISGEWGGTMNLTEPHCGTDLGLLRTRAEPNGDGSYAITGTKIFISSGEHDLTENIIHLVLAKTPGAPDSSKGISLFIVPKYFVNDDGSLGEHNKLICGSIEHKMGIHANSTCVMNYDGATGWMVGIQGLSQGSVAYQNAVTYAMDRRQGRALTGPAEPQEKADPLFVHPDVRRMLMDGKALTEGLRALAVWGALQVDLSHVAETEEERQLADDLISLLTPVIKGYGTDKGYEVATNAQQVYGGHGYIEEWGMSQFVRDARITMIYEGGFGVQAMDLVGRKLATNGGRAIQTLFGIIDQEIADAKGIATLADYAGRLEKSANDLKAATMWFMQNGMANPNNIGAGAHHYMHIMGTVALGLMWLRMARVAQAKLDAGEGDADFYKAKLVTARHFSERMMPDTGALRRKIEAGSDAMMELVPEMFVAA